MLIEFQVENFRSFRRKQTFSMVAAAFPEREATNTFDSGLRGFDRFVRSAVIYGPNAAGKTNLLRAIQFMQALVVNSAVSSDLGSTHSPFKFSVYTRTAPSKFRIAFDESGTRYEYSFTLGAERIEHEWLVEYVQSAARTRSRSMFERTWDARAEQYKWKFSSYLKGQKLVWSETTRPDALFLSTAIQLNSTQLRPVFDWFQKRLVVIVGGVKLNESLTIKILGQPGGKERVLPFLREADLGVSDLAVERERLPSGGIVVAPAMIEAAGGAQNVIKVTLSHHSSDPNEPDIGLDFDEESHGTQTIFRTAGAWLNVFANGEVLLFDEMDTSLHPLLIRYLINRFHSDTTNPRNAQLICTLHNTSLLTQELFRRDQIWFVEKESDGSSKLYPLTDFSPRNDEVLERWYMRGRYGALPLLPESATS